MSKKIRKIFYLKDVEKTSFLVEVTPEKKFYIIDYILRFKHGEYVWDNLWGERFYVCQDSQITDHIKELIKNRNSNFEKTHYISYDNFDFEENFIEVYKRYEEKKEVLDTIYDDNVDEKFLNYFKSLEELINQEESFIIESDDIVVEYESNNSDPPEYS